MRFSSVGSLSTGQGVYAVPVFTAGVTAISVVPASQVTTNANQAFEYILQALAVANGYAAVISGTVGAGNKAIVELNNPNASGRFVYVYAIDVFSATGMAYQLLLNGTSLAPVGTGFNLSAGGAVGVAKVGGGNQLSPTGSLIYSIPTLAANADYPLLQPWVCRIPPNTNLQVQAQTVATAFTCNVRWIESPT